MVTQAAVLLNVYPSVQLREAVSREQLFECFESGAVSSPSIVRTFSAERAAIGYAVNLCSSDMNTTYSLRMLRLQKSQPRTRACLKNVTESFETRYLTSTEDGRSVMSTS